MEEFLDENLLSIITSLQLFFARYYGLLVGLGKAIGGTLCLVVVASEAFQMMQLKKGVDVLALLRPILIALVLANWGSFTAGLRQPFLGPLEGYAKSGIYRAELNKVNQKHQERMKLQMKQYQVLQDARTKAQVAEDAMKKDQKWYEKVWDDVKDGFDKIVDTTKVIKSLASTISVTLLDMFIGLIASLIWNCAVMITFFAREVGLGILTITGPVTFGLSVLPVWKDSWANWVARYISLCLYGFVAYLIMAAALQCFLYGISIHIKQLSTPGLQLTDFMHMTSVYTLIGAVTGAYGLRMVPELVSWIVPSNSGMAISHFVSGVSGSATGAVKTGAKAIGGSI